MDDKAEQVLFLPQSMFKHIVQEANRLDKSLSWCVQFAWQTARGELTKVEPLSRHPGADAIYKERYANDHTKGQITLYFPVDMLQEIKSESTRQDRSMSWLVGRAWCLALKEVSAMPSMGTPE